MNYTIYNPDTGEIQGILSFSDDSLINENLSGKTYILGQYDSKKYYIDNQQAVEKPSDPSDGIKIYTFDYNTKQWTININQTTVKSRAWRDQLLSKIDRVNPVWYASLTDQQQTELQTYRQALLDVPQQAGFPTEIDWPAKPTWL